MGGGQTIRKRRPAPPRPCGCGAHSGSRVEDIVHCTVDDNGTGRQTADGTIQDVFGLLGSTQAESNREGEGD